MWGDRLRLLYSFNGGPEREYPVSLRFQRCHFGGVRALVRLPKLFAFGGEAIRRERPVSLSSLPPAGLCDREPELRSTALDQDAQD